MSQLRTNSIVPVGGIPAGASGGGIIQCVQVVKTDGYGQNSGWADVPGLSLNITPRSTSNKIIIMCTIGCTSINSNGSVAYRLYRGATLIASGDPVNSSVGVWFRSSQMINSDHGASDSHTYLDSPATTSQITYKIQMNVQSAMGAYLNRDYNGNNTSDTYGSRTISTLTALEISG
jgi:hypothetical protein